MAIRELERLHGSKFARQAVTSADVDANDGVTGVDDSEGNRPARKREITRTPRKKSGGDGVVSSSSVTDPGVGPQDPSDNPFLAGLGAGVGEFGDAFLGSGYSQTMKDWGVLPTSRDEIFADPHLFLELFDQNVGASPHMDATDFDMFASQMYFNGLADPGAASNAFDITASRASNAQTPGGNFMRLSDVMAWINSGTPGMEAELNQRDSGFINNMMLGAVRNNYPTPIFGALENMLGQASTEYDAAVATGYKGTYMEFLNENGYAQYLGGM